MQSSEYIKGFADGLQWVLDQYCNREVKEGARNQIRARIKVLREKLTNEDNGSN